MWKLKRSTWDKGWLECVESFIKRTASAGKLMLFWNGKIQWECET